MRHQRHAKIHLLHTEQIAQNMQASTPPPLTGWRPANINLTPAFLHYYFPRRNTAVLDLRTSREVARPLHAHKKVFILSTSVLTPLTEVTPTVWAEDQVVEIRFSSTRSEGLERAHGLLEKCLQRRTVFLLRAIECCGRKRTRIQSVFTLEY